jgi:phosphoglycerol transferase MdoB-like AlkP superfamily enzyme
MLSAGTFILHSLVARKDGRVEGSGSIAVPGRWRAAAIGAAILLSTSLVTRVALVWAESVERTLRSGDFLRAFAEGAVADLEVALWLTAPLAFLLSVAAGRRLRSRRATTLLAAGLSLTLGAALFVGVAEYFFFQEFNGRFNFVAVDYLLYPTEVAGNIWQSYHTGWVLTGIALLSIAGFVPFRRALRRGPAPCDSRGQRLLVPALWAAALALSAIAPRDRVGRFSSDRVVNEIAGNGYRSFWSALLGQDAPYEGLYRTAGSADASFLRLRRLLSEPATVASSFTPGSTLRHIHPLRAPRRANVVLVLEESLGAEFVGALRAGATSNTPELDALVPQGTFLTHAYSTGNRTIRALEATTASLPPLPGISIVRRSESHDLFTLPELLRARGYHTLFVYGGRALFDGMGRYMRSNGVERVVELSDFPKDTFRTAWGVCDEAIFDRAIEEMDDLHRSGRPFYTAILTVTNHRPFLYPPGRIAADPEQKKRVNAVRYADYALGRFVREARRHDFFDDTLFVLMGDHGARVYGAAEIPLPSYEVPILFFAPKFVASGARVPTLASAMDVPPTILGLLGFEYDSKFFGRDVLALGSTEGRAPMTHNNEIALLQGNELAVLGLRGVATVYRYEPAAETLVPQPLSEVRNPAPIEDAVAYYEGADRLYREGGYRFVPDSLAQASPEEASRAGADKPDARARKKG